MEEKIEAESVFLLLSWLKAVSSFWAALKAAWCFQVLLVLPVKAWKWGSRVYRDGQGTAESSHLLWVVPLFLQGGCASLWKLLVLFRDVEE